MASCTSVGKVSRVGLPAKLSIWGMEESNVTGLRCVALPRSMVAVSLCVSSSTSFPNSSLGLDECIVG